jgi:hypothetical protein
MYKDKAQLTGAGFEKLVLSQWPETVVSLMHVVDLKCKSYQEMINIITKAGQSTGKWGEAKKNLHARTPKTKEKP